MTTATRSKSSKEARQPIKTLDQYQGVPENVDLFMEEFRTEGIHSPDALESCRTWVVNLMKVWNVLLDEPRPLDWYEKHADGYCYGWDAADAEVAQKLEALLRARGPVERPQAIPRPGHQRTLPPDPLTV